MRGSWRLNKDCNILTPLLWPSALCLSRSPDAQLQARGLSFLLSAGFLYHILSPTGLWNYWGPQGPLRPGVAFPTTSYQQLLWSPTLLTSNSIRGPEGPFSLVWLSLPHLISNSIWSLTHQGPKGPLHRAFSTTSYQQLNQGPQVNLTSCLDWVI